MLRQRDPEKIRMDAIQMGVKKAKSNCEGCAESYFELARKHGATEQQIQQALEDAVQVKGKNLSRRDLIKVVAASGLALGGVELFVRTAQADQFGDWYGTDSNTVSAYGMQQDLYIGRMGQALSFDPPGFWAFNTAAAQATQARVGNTSRTFGFWAVHGPTSSYRPSGYSDYNWGAAQASIAWSAWSNSPNEALIGGYTVFGQVEPQTPGWDTGNYGPNRAVVNGFLDRLFAITPSTPLVWPGLYITPNNWSQLLDPNFTQNFNTTTNFVLWISGIDTCGSNICAPCASGCYTQPTVHAEFQKIINTVYLSNMVPVLWQYWIGDCGCNGDYDVTRQDTNSFQPVVAANAAITAASVAKNSTVRKPGIQAPKKK